MESKKIITTVFRVVYVLFFLGLLYWFVEVHDKPLENNGIYSYIVVAIIGFFIGIFLGKKLVLRGWWAIAGLLISLFTGVFLGGMLFITPEEFSGLSQLGIGLASNISLAVAAAIFSNYKSNRENKVEGNVTS